MMNCGQLLLLFCFLSVLTIVEAIKCYQCESHLQEGCYPLNTTVVPLTDCPPDARSCRFLQMDAHFIYAVGEQAEPRRRYIRSCSLEKSMTSYSCLDRAGTSGNIKSTYCECNSDGCNPAGRNAMMNSGAITTLMLLVSYLA